MSNDPHPPTASHPGPANDPASPTAAQPEPVEAGSTRDPDAPTAGFVGDATEAAVHLAPPGYELLEEIGSGGMGVVYRARDIALNRHVALKILHTRYATDGVAARRFNDEAAITGQLQHPGIPPIHQIGTLPDARPFLAMKLIKGSTLEDLLRERTSPAEDRGRFLAVFEQVCQAVGYAHAHNVIHRDLKPANVMVGSFAEVQVMDWGLAKTLTADRSVDASATEADETLGTEILSLRDLDSATQAGSILGTPAYMPPEQAGGEIAKIDTRSDVFGLGAILCVILTGKPPYAAKDSETARLMAIRGQLDEGLARLDASGAEPELIALCKRCLSLDPAGRPANGGEVAAAVAGFREDAEERARQAELERARAEVQAMEQRKRRRVQAGLGMTVTVVVALVGFGLWWNERQKSAAAAERASRRSRTAASVSAALDDARVRTAEAWALSDEPVKMRTATDLALAAVRRAEGFANTGDAPEEILGELAAAQAAAADLDRHTRLFDAADLILRNFVSDGLAGRNSGKGMTGQLGEAFGEFGWDPLNTPAETIAAEIAASRVRNKVLGFLSDWEFQSGGNRAIQEKVRAVIRAARLQSGGLLADWQRAKDAGDPALLEAFAARPDVLTLGPELLCALDRDLRAAGRHDAKLALLRRATDRYPTHVWLNFDLAETCAHVTPARPAEALRAAAAATTARPNSAILESKLAAAYADIGELDLAAAHYRKAIAVAPTYGYAYQKLGAILTRAGDPNGDVTVCRDAIRLNPENVFAHARLCVLLRGKGDLDGALAAAREMVRLFPQDAGAHAQLGWTYRARREYDPAATCYVEVVRLLPRSAQYRYEYGLILMDKGDMEEAIASFREALKIDPRHSTARQNLVKLLRAKRDLDGAVEVYQAAVRLDPKNAAAHDWVAYLLLEKGEPRAALPYAERAVELNRTVAQHWINLGRARSTVSDLDGANAAFRKAIELDPAKSPVRYQLATLLLAKGDVDGAFAAFDLSDLPYTPETRDIHTRCWIATAALAAWFDQTARYDAVCDRALTLARETDDPVVAQRVAVICSIRPGREARQDAAVTLARRAVEKGGRHTLIKFFRFTLGMSEYRAGRFADAARTLDFDPPRGPFVATVGFYRAMSLYRAGETDQAREVALTAAAVMRPMPKDPKNPLTNANADDVILWLAYREAKELIGFPEVPPKK